MKVPEVAIPIEHKRNSAALVEVASLNQRLKNKGHFTAKDLDKKLQKEFSKKK
ncbi:hypothetical protein AGMMS50233_03500 [Endomicrobiia bacterium]|nr:hypothetical protein AGMMS50233_03500 [Endomicrobiia bacterium]